MKDRLKDCYTTINQLHCYTTINQLHCYTTINQLHCYTTINQLHCYTTINQIHCYTTINQLQQKNGVQKTLSTWMTELQLISLMLWKKCQKIIK